MQTNHFEHLKPVCPRCKTEQQIYSELVISNASMKEQTKNGENIIEGSLRCSNTSCRLEYPIVDGIPIIVNNLQKYLNDNFYHITARNNLTPVIEAIMGNAAGPGSVFNNSRHHLSSYAWDHYADLAPDNEFGNSSNPEPGSILNCLNAGINLCNLNISGPVLDIGCAVGRTTFELAGKSNSLTLGIDVNFWMLRTAQLLLRTGTITFPLKRLGIAFDHHEYNVNLPNTELVDFWACDALALPFKTESFNFVNAMNVFDVIPSPVGLLTSIGYMLAPNGKTILTSPYDWSPPVPPKNWINGYSQPKNSGNTDELPLKKLITAQHSQLSDKLKIIGEIENHPWYVRVHSRRTALYDVHIVACEKPVR